MMHYSTQEQAVINAVVKEACKLINPDAIYLFGSRARGDARANSDFDFAFMFNPQSHEAKEWPRFAVEFEEKAPTLLSIDLVNMNEISEAFKKKILQEGKIIYERGKP